MRKIYYREDADAKRRRIEEYRMNPAKVFALDPKIGTFIRVETASEGARYKAEGWKLFRMR